MVGLANTFSLLGFIPDILQTIVSGLLFVQSLWREKWDSVKFDDTTTHILIGGV